MNRALPKHQRDLGLKVNTSNLCSEITLPTGTDHDGKERTAVCCLSSLNIETWDQWGEDEGLVEDVLRMLDNVLTSFIETAPDSMARAKYSALRERSVGLGVMGFHSFLQMKAIPMESAMAKSWNLRIFRKIRREADAASYNLALERGACPDAEEKGMRGPLFAQAGDRPHGIYLHHLRRHFGLRRGRSRPMSIPTRRCRALVLGAQSLSCWRCWKRRVNSDATWRSPSSNRKARCSIWTA